MTAFGGVDVRRVAAASAFAAVLLLIALLGGGWWILGRVDPLLAVPGAGWAAVAATVVVRRIVWQQTVGGGLAAGLAALAAACLWKGTHLPLLQLLGAGVALAVALLAAGWLHHLLRSRKSGASLARRVVLSVLLVAFAIGWQWAAWQIVPRAYALPTMADVRVTLISSLPLSSGNDDIGMQLRGEARDEPALALLRRQLALTQDDDLTTDTLAQTDILLLAHPQALRPQTLVAIDDWVRAGGKAVVLADGLSSWPPAYPLGDVRNPPVTSLLTPLLSRWGLRLDAPSPSDSGTMLWWQGDHRLLLLSPGRFSRENGSCRLSNDGIFGDCAIGAGRVLLLADADLLHADLWSDGLSVRCAASWSSANILFLLDKIGDLAGSTTRLPLATPVWVGDAP